MGCGRGAVLLATAKRLPAGKAVGVDLWQADQTDNSASATLANAELEGIADRIELHTSDMTALPFDDNSFDAIVSSLAIHNIPGHDGHRAALNGAIRVLKPGGRLGHRRSAGDRTARRSPARPGLAAGRPQKRRLANVARRTVDFDAPCHRDKAAMNHAGTPA
jgi:cyclopropane fatty-acyl-phospholipid synthase-like methyltransferase